MNRLDSRRLSIALAATAALAAMNAGVCAQGSLGTAGPLRMVGEAQCDAGYVALMQGACDPAPVDPALSPAKRANAHVERAIKLISLLRMEQARKDVDQALAGDPRNVAALKLRARMGGNLAARADINAALLLAPLDSDALATRAFLLDGVDNEAALEDVNNALKIDSGNADALWIRARLFIAMGKLNEADKDLSHALLVEPGYRRARTLRASLRMRLGRAEDAARDATIVIESQPDMTALQVRALAWITMGKFDLAIADLTAILGDPGSPGNADPAITMLYDLYIQRAMAFVRVGRENDAMMDLEVATRLGGPKAVLRMQVYLRSHGFPDIAIDGKRSPAFNEAMVACFVNEACGRGISMKI